MDDYRVNPDVLQENHVLCKFSFQTFLLHGGPAVLDDEGGTGKGLYVRERLKKGFYLFTHIVTSQKLAHYKPKRNKNSVVLIQTKQSTPDTVP
ncbi:MAG: hypothetical protein A4E63_01007 [Syntrophorhabdus sp. PtaU1.Bin050]|nr:MAG: hypothetical protein A4E63_01007 [Syntrophorhabdus sp. PtaU1.Bin050]